MSFNPSKSASRSHKSKKPDKKEKKRPHKPKSSHVVPTRGYHIAQTPVHNFLKAARGTSDGKGKAKSLTTQDERKVAVADPETMTLYSSLTNPLDVYRFRLGGYTTANLVNGLIDVFVAADPSPSGWNSPEWASLATLFSEFKLVSLSLKVVRNFMTSPPAGFGALAIASNLGLATNAGSYATIADNADVRWYNQHDTSVSGIQHTMQSDQIGWSEVLTPTNQPFAGAPGCIQLYSINNLSTGTGNYLYQIIISGIYDFRVRV